MKKIFAILLSLTVAISLAMLSVSAESLEVVEATLPPVDPSQTYEIIIIPEETTTSVVTTTVQKAKPAVTTTKPAVTTAKPAVTTVKPAVITTVTTKPVSKPTVKRTPTQKEVNKVAESSILPTSIAFNIFNFIR